MLWVAVCGGCDWIGPLETSDDLAFVSLVEHSEPTHGLVCIGGSTLVPEGTADFDAAVERRAAQDEEQGARRPWGVTVAALVREARAEALALTEARDTALGIPTARTKVGSHG